jgi:hypothetical protein
MDGVTIPWEAANPDEGVPVVRRIQIHEDQQYRWWWSLYDGERVTMHGPYDTKHAAKHAAHVQEPLVHVATIPWKLP